MKNIYPDTVSVYYRDRPTFNKYSVNHKASRSYKIKDTKIKIVAYRY